MIKEGFESKKAWETRVMQALLEQNCKSQESEQGVKSNTELMRFALISKAYFFISSTAKI